MAGAAAAAVPYVLRAAETEAAIGAYRDALRLVDSVVSQATGTERVRLYALRADLLAATADPGVVQAYREAIGVADESQRRILRARLARMAAHSGDLLTADAALAGLEPDGGPADAMIMMVRGMLAYLRGDHEAAWQATVNARRITVGGGETWTRRPGTSPRRRSPPADGTTPHGRRRSSRPARTSPVPRPTRAARHA
jgi:hypothetical protein